MVSERDSFIDLVKYIESFGISVNVAKNKARGNQGVFIAGDKKFRIDISKQTDSIRVFGVLLHEFAHYIHYNYDSSLSSLDFIFGKLTDDEEEELLRISVDSVPKEQAVSLYKRKLELSDKIGYLSTTMRKEFQNFRLSVPFKQIENHISYPAKYLLKYDKVSFLNKVYTIDNIETDFVNMSKYEIMYIRLKSLQRQLKRLNSRINKLNKYYNKPTELWARFCEMFFTDKTKVLKLAPNLSLKFEKCIENNKIKELSTLSRIINKK